MCNAYTASVLVLDSEATPGLPELGTTLLSHLPRVSRFYAKLCPLTCPRAIEACRRHPACVHMRMVHPTLHVALPNHACPALAPQAPISHLNISTPPRLASLHARGITTKPPAAHTGSVAHVHSTSKTHSGVPCENSNACFWPFVGLEDAKKIYSDRPSCMPSCAGVSDGTSRGTPTRFGLRVSRRHIIHSCRHALLLLPPFGAAARSAAQPPDRCC